MKMDSCRFTLEKLVVTEPLKISELFFEPKERFPHSKGPAIAPYPEPHKTVSILVINF